MYNTLISTYFYILKYRIIKLLFKKKKIILLRGKYKISQTHTNNKM